MQDYDRAFYAEGREHALRSARRMVPEILRLVAPASVVDVGCGVGTWLSVFREHGVEDLLGMDGDHVVRDALEIPARHFIARDLARGFSVDRRFDLAMSLEVAEHLPASAARGFVTSLCELAPVVLFSAAVPSQGGVHHVNEQWPDYWSALFREHGYLCADALRPVFWTDPDVTWWYAQNTLLFVSEPALDRHPELANSLVEMPRRLAHDGLVECNHHRKRLLDALLDILAHVRPGAQALVADDAQLLAEGPRVSRDFRWIPFLSRDGEYWGAPGDAAQAIAELEHMHARGADTLVLAWPSFWWLEHFPEFAAHLDGHYTLAYRSDEIVIYDLGGRPAAPA